MTEYEVFIPHVAGRVSVTARGFFTGARLFVDGRPATKGGRGRFPLPKADGGRAEARLVYTMLTYVPAVTVDGVRYEVGPKLPLFLAILAFLPFALVFAGGALGGLCGGIGWAVSSGIARGPWPIGAKVPAMLGTTVLAVGAYAALAMALQGALGGSR
jgi:hypothetical protein